MEHEGETRVRRTEPTPFEHALDLVETGLSQLVKVAEDGGLADHDDLGLIGVVQRVERLRNRLALVDHPIVSALDDRRVAEAMSQPSTAALLAIALRISRGEANRRVRAAEQVGVWRTMTGETLPPRRPALAAAQRAGEASAEQVDICLRALATVDHRGFDPADLDTADQLLAGFTAGFGPKDLTDLARQVVDRIDPDGTLPTVEVDAERRFLTLRTARDGMCLGEFRLTPALAVKLKTVLSPLAAPRNTVVAEHDGRPVTEVDPRHHGQRMHDALEDACDRLLRSGTLPDSGGTPTTVIITTTLDPSGTPSSEDWFRRTGSSASTPTPGSARSAGGQPPPTGKPGETGEPSGAGEPSGTIKAGPTEDHPHSDEPGDGAASGAHAQSTSAGGTAWQWGSGTASDGTHLSPDTVADLVDSAAVHPTFVDAKGVVLWMGRTSRLATPGQTMALVARDGGCSFPGCEHPPEWCERHHVVAWAEGGLTDVDNLTLLCRYHHRQFLTRGWTCRIVDRLPTWYPPTWLDPDQKPLRNTRITTRHLVC